MSDTLSIVLFSGTEDKLHAAATITAGAAAIGTPASILLMYWALDAFRPIASATITGSPTTQSRPRWKRAGRARLGHPLARDVPAGEGPRRSDHRACAGLLATLGLDATAMDPLVDDAGGIASFLAAAEGGQILFI